MERAGSLTASAAETVAGHVTLDISCIDRLYLNRKKPVVSLSLFEPIGAKFRKDPKDWTQANGVR